MRFSRFGYLVSGLLCALSIILFATVGLNVGVDFKGGTVITIRTEQAANLDQLRATINGLGLGAAELQEFGSPNDVLIRIGVQEGGEEAQQAAIQQDQGFAGQPGSSTAASRWLDRRYRGNWRSRAFSRWSSP